MLGPPRKPFPLTATWRPPAPARCPVTATG